VNSPSRKNPGSRNERKGKLVAMIVRDAGWQAFGFCTGLLLFGLYEAGKGIAWCWKKVWPRR
jgi:hypothetical protein